MKLANLCLAFPLRDCDMSLVVRKPVLGICDHGRLGQACSATEASWRLEISDIETRQRNNKGVDQIVWMRRLICTFVVRIC